jgi:SAM-dependent methyltransferase
LNNQTAVYWGENYFSQTFNRQEWQAHPLTIERQYRIQNLQMREVWFANNYLKNGPAKRAIGIGVGRAETEIELLANGAVEHYDLFDVSPVGLEYAKSCAEKRGFGRKVTCHCMPISEAKLPPDTYDLATFVASLHHMQPLEGTLRIVNQALKQEGMIWCANEYIGPDRFNYPDTHANIARSFFRQLPASLRNRWHDELPLPTPEEVAAADPTEAPCSSQIEPLMRRMFPRFELTPLYGAFAFISFWGLNHDALYETPEGGELVRFILAMDQALTESGILPTYFAHIVAKKTTIWQERAIRMGIDPYGKAYSSTQKIKSAISKMIRRA